MSASHGHPENSMNTDFSVCLEENLKEMPICLNERQLGQFAQFYEDLIEKNKVMNLTAITEQNEVIDKHIVDSLSIIRIVPDIGEKSRKIIDLGTGAGFPGIPMAIAWPNLNLFLADSQNKKINFIREEAEKLGLKNLTAEHGRAEDFGQSRLYREKFDICVSRAVANLSTLSEYCLPFIHQKGWFIPYKSGMVDTELKDSEKAVRLLGGSIKKTVRFQLPSGSGERTLILIEKTGITPRQYPRKAGTPQKAPL